MHVAVNPHLPLALLLGAAVAAPTAGCGSDAVAQPRADPAAGLTTIRVVHDDPGNPESAQVLPGLERALSQRLPASRYGCVVAPPDRTKDESAKLIVFVTSKSAARDADAVASRLGASSYATTTVSPNQWLEHDRRAILGALRRQAARFSIGGRSASRFVAAESEIDRTSCPRIEIALVDGHPVYNRWARHARASNLGRVILTPPVRFGTAGSKDRDDRTSDLVGPS